MSRTTDFLTCFRRIIKLHEGLLKEQICSKYQLTLMEATIISFLMNNPEKDTAADIAELRMLSKGNISQGVEGLIQKSLLERKRDDTDRRRIHLSLTPEAEPITASMEQIWRLFHDEIFSGLTAEELAMFDKFNGQIMENTKKALADLPQRKE